MFVRRAFVFVLLATPLGCGRSGPTVPRPAPESTPEELLHEPGPTVGGPFDLGPQIDYEAPLNDQLGKGVTPDRNANVLIRKALGPTPDGSPPMPAEFYKRLSMAEPEPGGAYFVTLRAFDAGRLDPAEFKAAADRQTRAAQRPWVSADDEYTGSWLHQNEKPLAVIVEATQRPDYFNPIVASRTGAGRGALLGADLAGVQRCREVARALTCRAMLRLGEGKADAAWQDLLACHRLGRHISRCATLIEALVGIAVDQTANQATLAFLAHGKLTPDQIRACLKDLQALPPMPGLADKLDLGERSFYLDTLQRFRRGESLPSDPAGRRPVTPGAFNLEPALKDGNGWYDRLAAALRVPDRAGRSRAIEQVNADFKAAAAAARPANMADLMEGDLPPDQAVGKAMGYIVSGQLYPAVAKVQDPYDRAEQGRRNVRVAFALAAYRAEHGRYPAALADLAPKYTPEVPADLFSGKPLAYHPAADGYLLSSVGVNGTDDGGRGDDVSVRMPLPGLKGRD